MSQKNFSQGKAKARRILSGVYAGFCIILVLLLICNITIIVKGVVSPERPPSVLGMTPMVVLSGSMSGEQEGHIEIGDLIVARKVDAADLKVGDVISYMDGKSAVTHRIIGIVEGYTGNLFFETKGDANNAPDLSTVSQDQLIGKFWFRIPYLGDFALFLQQPLGMLLFVGVPLIAFLLYDIIRRRIALDKELKRLREKAGEEPAEN